MKEQISSLTSEQAQRALLLFYEKVRDEIWEGSKPSPADIKFWSEELQEEAPPDTRPFLATLLYESDQYFRGEVAKILLIKFAEDESLLPNVEDAVSRATEPYMAPLPIIMGAVIVALAVVPKEIKTDKVHIKFGQLEEASKFIEKLTEFINSLPDRLWKGEI
ncbi:MAG: hypothetical protein HXS46_13040 [Theionarchaea archaeon]|nr:MAG: hypothetical protein AYK18_11730 [Theionarchaea archaeon DG-70]MBU7011609.1 hypothetical protein [Theionarchaea archaeon]